MAHACYTSTWDTKSLDNPLRWRKPRSVRVLSDLFHEDVPFEFIAAVFGVMAACPQHTFQVLTKRPERALAFFEWLYERGQPRPLYCVYASQDRGVPPTTSAESYKAIHGPWPLKNVWLGVSVACQPDADKLVPIVLKCPAAVRFVSAEPLIEAVDLSIGFGCTCASEERCSGACPYYAKAGNPGTRLDWVIVGGESGTGARPCDVAWVRSIVQQCKAAGVAVFVKQLGSNSQEQFGGSGALRPRLKGRNIKGGDPSEWPEDLRVRQFPEVAHA